MTEKKPGPESWEGYAERLIREAQADGQFEGLPGFGQPLPDLGDPNDELWWVKRKLRRERLSALPPGLQIRALVEQRLSRIWELDNEQQVRREVEQLNEQIREAWYRTTWGPSNTTRPLDAEEVVARWRQRRDAPDP